MTICPLLPFTMSSLNYFSLGNNVLFLVQVLVNRIQIICVTVIDTISAKQRMTLFQRCHETSF